MPIHHHPSSPLPGFLSQSCNQTEYNGVLRGARAACSTDTALYARPGKTRPLDIQALNMQALDIQVGMRVRFYRERRGISSAAMERALALPLGSLPLYEQGHRRFSIRSLNRLCAVYGAPLLHFFAGMSPADISHYTGP